MRAHEFITDAVTRKSTFRPGELHPAIAKMTINDVPKPFVDAFAERGITNPNTVMAYYKVAGKETKALGGPENMDYSGTKNKYIVSLFGEPNSWRGTNKSNPRNLNYLSSKQLDWLKSDPQRFGQFLYGGQRAKIVPDPKQGYRMEFDKPEDQQRAEAGWSYRGKGPVQITGRDQYAKVSQELYGDDTLVKNPDLVNDPAVGLRASAAYAKLYGNAHQDQSATPTDSLNRALVTVGGSVEKYKPGGRMYQKQIDGINAFGQNLVNPEFKKQHDQHYAGVQLTKPPTTQVANAEPSILDKIKTFGQQVGQGISNLVAQPSAQATSTASKPSFAPGTQGLPIPSTGSADTKSTTDAVKTQIKTIK